MKQTNRRSLDAKNFGSVVNMTTGQVWNHPEWEIRLLSPKMPDHRVEPWRPFSHPTVTLPEAKGCVRSREREGYPSCDQLEKATRGESGFNAMYKTPARKNGFNVRRQFKEFTPMEKENLVNEKGPKYYQYAGKENDFMINRYNKRSTIRKINFWEGSAQGTPSGCNDANQAGSGGAGSSGKYANNREAATSSSSSRSFQPKRASNSDPVFLPRGVKAQEALNRTDSGTDLEKGVVDTTKLPIPRGESWYAKAKKAEYLDKDLDKAIQYYQKAVTSNDRSESAIKDLAGVLHQRGKTVEACDILRQYRQYFMHDLEKYDNLLKSLEKQIVPSINTLNKVLRLRSLINGSRLSEDVVRSLFKNSTRIQRIEFINEGKYLMAYLHFSSHSAARKTLDGFADWENYKIEWISVTGQVMADANYSRFKSDEARKEELFNSLRRITQERCFEIQMSGIMKEYEQALNDNHPFVDHLGNFESSRGKPFFESRVFVFETKERLFDVFNSNEELAHRKYLYYTQGDIQRWTLNFEQLCNKYDVNYEVLPLNRQDNNSNSTAPSVSSGDDDDSELPQTQDHSQDCCLQTLIKRMSLTEPVFRPLLLNVEEQRQRHATSTNDNYARCDALVQELYHTEVDDRCGRSLIGNSLFNVVSG